MPLDLFHHDRLSRYQTSESLDHRFKHTFGGDYRQFGLRLSNLAGPLHLLYLLDQDDPAVPRLFQQLQFLPLLYGFRYAAFEGEMVYSVTERGEVELLKPLEPEYSKDFPYVGHPAGQTQTNCL